MPDLLKKGIYYAIKAFKKVLKNFRGVPLEYNIVGEGENKKDYVNLIKEDGLSENIKILGWQTQEYVRANMSSSHIFILPRITSPDGDMEGIPVVLMEAMASGMPVISTYHSGIAEVVQDGISGFLVPEKNINALARRMLYLIEHPEIWPSMGQAGRTFIERHHNSKILNRQLTGIYG